MTVYQALIPSLRSPTHEFQYHTQFQLKTKKEPSIPLSNLSFSLFHGNKNKGLRAKIAHSSAMEHPLPVSSSEDVSNDAIIIEPVKEEGIHALMLFFPGAFTPPVSYFPLIELVQNASSCRLWAVVLDPREKVISAGMIEASIGGMITRAKERGFVPGVLSISNVYFAGHSVGSWLGRSIAKKQTAGFIQMGSCFFSTVPDNLVQYPKPVLTLGGALDGQLKLAGVVNHAREIYKVESEFGDFNTNAVKPVIIIPGMNHAQFSHGIPNKERGDLDGIISLEEAQSIAAKYIASFITLHLEDKNVAADQALEILKCGVGQTQKLYRTFWEALENQEMQAKHWQLKVAGLEELTEENIHVTEHDYLENFIYSKPWIDMKLKRIFVQIYCSPSDKYGINNNIWVKMKSSDAIKQSFNVGSSRTKIVSAKELNAETFQKAISLVPEVFQKRFQEAGKVLRFLDDDKMPSLRWIPSDVDLKPSKDDSNIIDVKSPVMFTGNDMPPRFAGMHYMKPLSLARCMEWILLDAFR